MSGWSLSTKYIAPFKLRICNIWNDIVVYSIISTVSMTLTCAKCFGSKRHIADESSLNHFWQQWWWTEATFMWSNAAYKVYFKGIFSGNCDDSLAVTHGFTPKAPRITRQWGSVRQHTLFVTSDHKTVPLLTPFLPSTLNWELLWGRPRLLTDCQSPAAEAKLETAATETHWEIC